jgi:hypothetical protein
MNSKVASRILLDACIFLVIIHGWWFVALPLALIGVSRHAYFIELIIAGLIYDSLFGLGPEMGIWGYVGILSSAGIFTLALIFKKIMRK